MEHLWGPSDDGNCVLQWESAGVDFFFKGQSVGMFSNTITVVGVILQAGASVIILGNDFASILMPQYNF